MKRMIALALAVAAAASLAAVAQARIAGTATLDRSREQRSADVTFAKWLTSLPNDPSAAGASMAGVVGGDVGPGKFAGIVLTEDTSRLPFWLATALYGFSGSKHSFIAYNHIVENDGVSPATATIRGVVIAGWMKGARVTGEYTVVGSCDPLPMPGNLFAPSCFKGTLHLRRGNDD